VIVVLEQVRFSVIPVFHNSNTYVNLTYYRNASKLNKIIAFHHCVGYITCI
jgi:hypothetical protein